MGHIITSQRENSLKLHRLHFFHRAQDKQREFKGSPLSMLQIAFFLFIYIYFPTGGVPLRQSWNQSSVHGKEAICWEHLLRLTAEWKEMPSWSLADAVQLLWLLGLTELPPVKVPSSESAADSGLWSSSWTLFQAHGVKILFPSLWINEILKGALFFHQRRAGGAFQGWRWR